MVVMRKTNIQKYTKDDTKAIDYISHFSLNFFVLVDSTIIISVNMFSPLTKFLFLLHIFFFLCC